MFKSKKLSDALKKFAGKQTLDHVLSSEGDSSFADQEFVDMTVMMSDIAGFQGITEPLSPEDLIGELNSYLGAAITAVHDTGGIVDQFVGNAVSAYWRSDQVPDHPTAAFRAASETIAALEARNVDARLPMTPRIGIATGRAMIANIGSEQRMQRTVIGDTVNSASRLSALCANYSVPILLDEATVEALTDKNQLTEADTVHVKGGESPMTIFTLNQST